MALRNVFEKYLDDVDDLSKRGFSPLHRIIFGLSKVDLESYLSLTTAELDIPCALGRTPLFWASIRQNPDHVRILLEHGASISIADRRQQTPLHVAAAYGNYESLELLLAKASALCEKSEAFHLAGYVPNRTWNSISKTYTPMQEYLEVTDLKGRTPLHGAAHSDQEQHARLLLQYHADIEKPDSVLNRTPLLLCAYWNHHKVMRVLLDHGARTDVVDSMGMSLLHYAAKFGDAKTMNILARKCRGLDTQCVDSEGRTASETFDQVRCMLEDSHARNVSRWAFMHLLRSTGSLTEELEISLHEEWRAARNLRGTEEEGNIEIGSVATAVDFDFSKENLRGRTFNGDDSGQRRARSIG